MAAAADIYAPELVELKCLRAGDLDLILAEEKLTWRSLLSWDFTASADLVSRFIRMQALNGHALMVDHRVVGYSYHVSDEHKGLIGDLFVSREFASSENEDLLLTASLQSLLKAPNLKRIEAQLMMLRGAFERNLPFAPHAQIYPRNFMLADLSEVERLPLRILDAGYTFEAWDEVRQDEAASLIANTYHSHIDSNINDQYKTSPGARRFLTNIVQYPGCGSFYAPASLLARSPDGRICGLVLASLVAKEVGHITQICVAPNAQGRGIGYELLRRSMCILQQNGCEKTSLTVTASNNSAIALYQQMGFRAVRRFAAYVWDGF